MDEDETARRRERFLRHYLDILRSAQSPSIFEKCLVRFLLADRVWIMPSGATYTTKMTVYGERAFSSGVLR